MSLRSTLRFLLRHPMGRRHPVNTLARFAEWQVVSRLSRFEQVVRWFDEVEFVVRSGETGLTGNLYTGLHEFEDMGFVLHALRPGDLFVDVGANAGSYTLLACAGAGAAGISIEPIPATFARLRKNVALNRLEGRVECHPIGLAGAPGVLRFVADCDTVNHALAPGEEAGETLEIPVETLDNVMASRDARVLKIDVEGLEAEVLAGAMKTLATPGPRAVILETNESGRRYGREDDELIRTLVASGYGPVEYEPFARSLLPRRAGRAAHGNTIFVNDLEFFRARVRASRAYAVAGVAI
ncbi:MAG: FkbM family methyltransferase [Deltaproteobacteria bacterium]|nr:FkbM family methyltransferase [Deltaproteobacteria bacterium]